MSVVESRPSLVMCW